MADSDDLAALLSGNNDLVGRDLRSVEMEGFNLAGRDFEKSHLEKSNFSRGILSGSKFDQAHLSHVNFSYSDLHEIKMTQTAVTFVDFSNAILTGSDFSRSHFAGSNFNGALLSAANFTGCHINEGNTFEDSIADESTIFDDVTIFRPLARNPVFRFYKVERGKLVRKNADETSVLPTSKPIEFTNALTEINRTEIAIRSALAVLPLDDGLQGIGHNRPPLEHALTTEEVEQVLETLRILSKEIISPDVNSIIVQEAKSKLAENSSKIGVWVSKKADIFF